MTFGHGFGFKGQRSTTFGLGLTAIRLVCIVFRCHLDCLLDISFVVDHSGSIRDNNVGNVDNWQLVIEFMVDVVSLVNLRTSGTHVGCVSFGM